MSDIVWRMVPIIPFIILVCVVLPFSLYRHMTRIDRLEKRIKELEASDD
jgi:hypothetical protein